MKKFKFLFLLMAVGTFSALSADVVQAAKIGVVNTKKCLEDSKLGKQEQGNFEKMKSQMESVLQEKEHGLEDIESKLNDEDYLDSISSEAEAELKRKRRLLRQEAMQLQNQYMQTLQQANYKVIQNLTEIISKAAEMVAAEMGYDIVLNDEASAYYNKQLDISDKVVQKMNAIFEKELKEPKEKKENNQQF